MRLSAVIFAFLLIIFPVNALSAERILVFAAASLRDALEDAASKFEQSQHQDIVLSFAASSILAKQIASGAPAALYISADRRWIDWLVERGSADPNDIRIIAKNRLVVARRDDNGVAGELVDALSGPRFAMGNPNHVPSGRYAKQALEGLGHWQNIGSRAVFGENVRIAVEYIRSGAVDAAIVYASDIRAFEDLKLTFTFPESSHDEIVYPAVLPANSGGAGFAFLEFLLSETGQAILLDHGFLPAKN